MFGKTRIWGGIFPFLLLNLGAWSFIQAGEPYVMVKNWSFGVGVAPGNGSINLQGHLSQNISPLFQLSLKEMVEIRPYRDKVRQQNGNNRYTQYQEFRGSFGLALNKDFFWGRGLGSYLDIGFMVGGGDYAGSYHSPPTLVRPSLEVGFLKDVGRGVHLRGGLKYSPVFPDDPVRLSINIDVNILKRLAQ